MAKGPEITDEIRISIARLHKEHPKWTNSMIRNEVLSIMHQRDPSLPKGWPSKYSIDRIMPGVRDRVRRSKLEPDPLDKPWTIGSTPDSIPPEALPSVLRVWYWSQGMNHTLTIRQAQWAARLHAAIKDTESLHGYSIFIARMVKEVEDAGVDDPSSKLEVANLQVFSIMTGHKITPEDEQRVLGWSEEEWRQEQRLLPVKLKQFEVNIPEGEPPLRFAIHFEKTEPSQKEAKNERKHKAKKQE